MPQGPLHTCGRIEDFFLPPVCNSPFPRRGVFQPQCLDKRRELCLTEMGPSCGKGKPFASEILEGEVGHAEVEDGVSQGELQTHCRLLDELSWALLGLMNIGLMVRLCPRPSHVLKLIPERPLHSLMRPPLFIHGPSQTRPTQSSGITSVIIIFDS